MLRKFVKDKILKRQTAMYEELRVWDTIRLNYDICTIAKMVGNFDEYISRRIFNINVWVSTKVGALIEDEVAMIDCADHRE